MYLLFYFKINGGSSTRECSISQHCIQNYLLQCQYVEVDKMAAVVSIDGCNLKKKLKHEMYFLKTTGAKILNNENRRQSVEVHKIAEKEQFLNNFHPFFSNANQEDL